MQSVAQLAALSGLLLMALLPIAVFRRGRPTAAWFITAAPFAVAGLLLCVALAGGIESVLDARATTGLAALAIPALATAGGLIVWTARVHSHRPALWHQPDDEPVTLVTAGPYAYVRHPFYAAFALLLLGTALALPHPASLAVLLFGVRRLRQTAAREEQRLLRSRFATAYDRYMHATGRLMPRLRSDAEA